MRSTIGVTGSIASGKGMVAELLVPRGYFYVSLSDEVRKETLKRGLPLERKILQDVGDSLRREFGNEILSRRVARTIEEMRAEGGVDKTVIDGLRNPGEIEWLKENFEMQVIGVTADPEIRFQRVVARTRRADVVTREEFDRAEGRDRGVDQTEHGNRVDVCLALADIVIENNGTPKELEERLLRVLEGWGKLER